MSPGPPDVTGLYVAAAVLLVGAGADKLRRPSDSVNALRTAGLPATVTRVRAAAGAEVVVATAALILPGPVPATLMAASYAGFAIFVTVALRRGLALASCGCFGRPDTPPSWSHVLVNAVAAAAATGWAATAAASVPATLSHQSWRAVPLGLGALVVAGLAAVVLTNPLTRLRRQ